MSTRALLAVALLVAGIALLVARRQGMDRAASADADRMAELERVFDSLETAMLQEEEASSLAAPERDEARIRFLLEARSEGSYFLELLDARDGWNYRWPDRPGNPMRIWVQPSSLPGFDPSYVGLVHDAVSDWNDGGLPIVFLFTPDSARAEILVTWVDRFSEPVTGITRWARDQHGWIVRGGIQLALHQSDGTPLDTAGIRAIARHEVGHLLGLDHTRDTTNVMSARVWVSELSEADRHTIRLVYDLPPGQLRASARPSATSPSGARAP